MTPISRTFTLKDETTISGHRDRGRFLRGLSEEDWPAVVPVAVEAFGDGEVMVPAPYDAAEHDRARAKWWCVTRARKIHTPDR